MESKSSSFEPYFRVTIDIAGSYESNIRFGSNINVKEKE